MMDCLLSNVSAFGPLLHGHNMISNTKEVTTDFNIGDNELLLSLCKYYSGGKYTAMHWVSMSAKFMVCLIITLQVCVFAFSCSHQYLT